MYENSNITNSESQFDDQAAIDRLPHTFSNSEFCPVRSIIVNGEPWFIAKDIAEALGYVNTSKAVNTHCNRVETCPTEMGGQVRHVQIIPEPDLYRLIAKSELPAAERFEAWIFEEVLPTIRKHGMYATPDFVESALADPDTMIQTLQALKEARQQRDHAIATKAWISRKREATAMNTASRLSKENTRLRDQVGDSKTWKQARAIPWLKDFFILNNVAYAQIGKKLTKESKVLGYEIKQAPHSKYGSVKIYHHDVIEHFKHKLISDLNLMRKYRKY